MKILLLLLTIITLTGCVLTPEQRAFSYNDSFYRIQQQNQQYENNRILRNIEHQQRIQNMPSVDVRRPFTIDRLLR